MKTDWNWWGICVNFNKPYYIVGQARYWRQPTRDNGKQMRCLHMMRGWIKKKLDTHTRMHASTHQRQRRATAQRKQRRGICLYFVAGVDLYRVWAYYAITPKCCVFSLHLKISFRKQRRRRSLYDIYRVYIYSFKSSNRATYNLKSNCSNAIKT